MKSIKIVVVDDHLLVLNGLEVMLKGVEHIQVIALCRNGDELLATLARSVPDVILMDIQLPGTDGIKLTRLVQSMHPGCKLLGLSNMDEKQYITAMLRSGASGYLLKNVDRDVLVAAIEAVHAGEQYVQKELQSRLLQEAFTGRKFKGDKPALTRREKEILQLIAEEHSNQEIAERLFLSVRTVENHRFNLMQKLGVKNVAGLVKEAISMGLGS